MTLLILIIAISLLIISAILFTKDELIISLVIGVFGIIFTFMFIECNKKPSNQSLRHNNSTSINMKISYIMPEEWTETVPSQRLVCDSVILTDSSKTIYYSFDKDYHIELSNNKHEAYMLNNEGKLLYNFDSSSEIIKVIDRNNE